MLWYAGPLLFSGYAISKHSAEQYVYLKAERLEHLFKQGYSKDAEMTFEVYARGWLERQTKYAPYDCLLPTFARNRVAGVGGDGLLFLSFFVQRLRNLLRDALSFIFALCLRVPLPTFLCCPLLPPLLPLATPSWQDAESWLPAALDSFFRYPYSFLPAQPDFGRCLLVVFLLTCAVFALLFVRTFCSRLLQHNTFTTLPIFAVGSAKRAATERN